MLLDHIAVAGETLEAACDYVQSQLGVRLEGGGEHGVFHTHNRLLGLEDGLYLEAIAINPNAPQPERPRWFDLDRFEGPARLSNWICRTTDLPGDMAQLPAGIGAPVDLQRGDLRWKMVVPQSGVLPFDNLCPALIQWLTPQHPAQMLSPSQCRLHRLIVSHPHADRLGRDLRAVFEDKRVVFEVGTPALRAQIDTPHGRRML